MNEISLNKFITLLPHAYPFLLVDRVEEFDQTKNELLTIKNITHNEPQFQGHFPNNPIYPGVLQIESMAQSAGICFAISDFYKKHEHVTDDNVDEYLTSSCPLFYLRRIRDVVFRSIIVPGDRMLISSSLVSSARGLISCNVKIHIESKNGTKEASSAQVALAVANI